MMRVSSRLRIVLIAGVAVAFAWPVFAQEEERTNTSGYNAIVDNLDLLVDNYAKFLARKYDLTEEQDEYTKYLLRERSYEFLDKREDSLRDLIDRMFDVRGGGDMDASELIEWGKQASPIYEEAKRLIIQENEEWREILTPEQKETHDADLQMMRQSFETTEEQLDRIITGEMTVEEFRSPQKSRRSSRSTRPNRRPEPAVEDVPPPDEPPLVSERPPRIRKPAVRPANETAEESGTRISRQGQENRNAQRSREGAGERSRTAPARSESSRARASAKAGDKKAESAWEKYVREFIEKYKLDNEQSQKANAILDDCQKQKEHYLKARQDQLDALDKQIAELRKAKGKDKKDDLSKLQQRKEKLTAPIDQIFDKQLKPRLERLPTRAQRRAAEAASVKKSAGKKPQRPPVRKSKDSSKKADD